MTADDDGGAGAPDAWPPPPRHPDAIRPTFRQLAGLRADPSGLLDHLRARITAEQLQAISRADHGHAHDAHLAQLQHIVSSGTVSPNLGIRPLEVLQLTRWREREPVDHVARAFACTVLVLGDPDLHLDMWGPLAQSAITLGEPVTGLAAGLAAWDASTETYFDGPDVLGALWALGLCLAAGGAPDAQLHALADALWDFEDEHLVVGCMGDALQHSLVPHLWRGLTRDVLLPRREESAIARMLQALGPAAWEE